MTITVTMPSSGAFSIIDIVGAIDFVAFDAALVSFGPTSLGLSGFYNGQIASASIDGSGFASDGNYITEGTASVITFTIGGDTIRFDDADIDMGEFSTILMAEDAGTNPYAMEEYFLARDWVLNLSDADDIAPSSTMIGDGVALDLLGDDIVRAGGGDDDLFSGGGDDEVYGESGKDKLVGGKGSDILFGGGGKDKIKGGNGKDDIKGGAGNDTLTGGNGADDFIFGTNWGKDKIKDFDALNNKEDIDLSAVSAITGIKDLRNNHMEQNGDNVVIADDDGNTITLLDVDMSDLGKGDFIF